MNAIAEDPTAAIEQIEQQGPDAIDDLAANATTTAPTDGDGDGIPNEYGDGPDLDRDGIPDEVGINPDNHPVGTTTTPPPPEPSLEDQAYDGTPKAYDGGFIQYGPEGPPEEVRALQAGFDSVGELRAYEGAAQKALDAGLSLEEAIDAANRAVEEHQKSHGYVGTEGEAGTTTPPPSPPVDTTSAPDYDGDGDGIPNEYGDGPDRDGNNVPDEVGINPDNAPVGTTVPPPEDTTTPPDGDKDGTPNEEGGTIEIGTSPLDPDAVVTNEINQAPAVSSLAADRPPEDTTTAPPPDDTSTAPPPSDLQFGNTGNLQNAPDTTGGAPPPDEEPAGIEFGLDPDFVTATGDAVQQSAAATGGVPSLGPDLALDPATQPDPAFTDPSLTQDPAFTDPSLAEPPPVTDDGTGDPMTP